MRRSGLLFFSLLIALTLLVPALVFADRGTINLESIILENFNPETRSREWIVRGSKFITEGFPLQAYAVSWPEAIHGANREGKALEVLGARAKWDRKGYNYLEFIPARAGDGGGLEPHPIPIPGRVQYLDLWAWGSNYDYYLEVHLSDLNGVVHVLRLGSLKYSGWRNLRTGIPSYIPQGVTYVPAFKGLDLVKLVLWTMPVESVNDYYIYLDQIKVLTDTFISRFDGDDLVQPEKLNEIWGGE